jgi:hypothetical protein
VPSCPGAIKNVLVDGDDVNRALALYPRREEVLERIMPNLMVLADSL